MLAGEARAFPLNYGSAEELLGYAPDVVLAGTFTSGFTQRLLAELGLNVVAIEPAASLADVERNLREVGAAIGERLSQGILELELDLPPGEGRIRAQLFQQQC